MAVEKAVETFEDNFFELDDQPDWPEKVHGFVLGSWVQGGANGVDNVPLRELAKRTSYLKREINTIIGLSPGGFLDAYNFGSDNPTQQALTDYALSQIGGADQLKIWNGTRVKNLFDENIWILVNTPDTDPPVFEWINNGPEIIVIGNASDFANDPILFASDKRKLTIRAGTRIELGTKTFFPREDVELNIPGILDTGNIANGKDYYIHLIPGGNYLDVKASLTKSAPAGLNPADVKVLGGLHTLCANAGSGMTYVEGGVTKQHPLNGFVASDILPYTVWSLNFRPDSEPEGMFYDPKMLHWVDIYLMSNSGINSKSAYQGAITRSRQYVDFVEDLICVKKQLLTDEEFASAAMGSNEQTAVAGSNEAGATSGGAGGRSDTAGRRMISIYGAEEMCGSLWQFLRTTAAAGADGTFYGQTDAGGTQGWISPTRSSYGPYLQSGGKGSFWGVACVLLAGGVWSDSACCGSRARYAHSARSCAASGIGGRGRSRTKR